MTFKVDQIVYAVGLNMNCDKVVARMRVAELQDADAHGQDCVVETHGMLTLCKQSDLYATRKEVKDLIK